MNILERRWRLGAFVIAAVALVGCATKEPAERQRSSTATSLAPRASVEAPASKATKAKLGITAWKIFRGKKDLHLTGYDAKGNAVKGLTAGFARSADGSEPILRVRINDGSHFAAVHGLRSQLQKATKPALGDSAAFTAAAFADASKLHALLQAKAKRTPRAADAQCGADLSSIVTKAIACIQESKGTKAAQAACIAAARRAAAANASCKNTGATTATPAKTSAPSSGGAGKKESASTPAKSGTQGGASTSEGSGEEGAGEGELSDLDLDDLDDLDADDLDDLELDELDDDAISEDDAPLDDLELDELDDDAPLGEDAGDLGVDELDGEVDFDSDELVDDGAFGDDAAYADYEGGEDLGGDE